MTAKHPASRAGAASSPSTAHTPGPWVAGKHSIAAKVNGRKVLLAFAVDGDEDSTCEIDLPAAANARLIAAAPELLYACKAALPGPLYRQPWHVVLVAAIAKATGESEQDEPDGAGAEPDLGAVDDRETLERGYPEAGR